MESVPMKLKIAILTILIGAFASSSLKAQDTPQEKAAAAMKALGLSELPGMTPDGPRVEAIGWRDLAKLLPKTLEGMTTGKIKGGTFNMSGMTGAGMPDSIKKAMKMSGLATGYSSAERTYTQDLGDGKTKRLTIRVMDAGMVKALLSPFFMAVEYDTPDGIMKSIEIAGYPARLMQKYDDDLEVSETHYMVLVSDRVLAQFEVNEYVKEDFVSSQAKSFPYDKLVSLAGAPVTAADDE